MVPLIQTAPRQYEERVWKNFRAPARADTGLI